MEALAGWLALWPGAAWLRGAATAYLLLNAAHILGLALLVGAILPLDARLLGLGRAAPVPALAPLLARVAMIGAALATLTGLWLLAVRPAEYLANPAFLVKMALVALALGNAGLQHASGAYRDALAGAPVRAGVRLRAAASMALWLGALLAGRWIGFL